VRQLRRGEVGPASRLLARAFAADPFIGHLLASPWRRRAAFPPFFRAALHELFTTTYALDVDGGLTGIAAWLPPEPPSDSVLARVNRAHVRALFPRSAPRLFAAFDELGGHHPHEPHWYLAFVWLEPGAQGRGLGAALLEPVLSRGELCYLETPFAGTRGFYERLGFEQTVELRPVAGAPPVWAMTRRV
jgi:GNAT superfamily N-acetyltransferase